MQKQLNTSSLSPLVFAEVVPSGSGVESTLGQPEVKSLGKTKWRDSSIDSPSQLSSAARGFLEIRADLVSLLEEICRGICG